MHKLTIVLGVTAALLHGVAYLLYARQTKVGSSSPKSASWGVWAFVSILNALTFSAMSGNWMVALQFFTGSVACVLVFLYMWAIGKLVWPTPKEWRLFSLGILAAIVWWVFRTAAGANMIVFIALATPFISMYEELWADPRKETPRSWILWTLASLVTTANVIVNWKGQPLNLVVPIGGAALHGVVAMLSSRSRKERLRFRFGS